MRRDRPGVAAAAAGLALAAAAAGLAGTAALRRRFTVITVTGDSMMPTLAPGDRMLVRRTGAGRLRRGQIVVVEMPAADGRWPASLRAPAAQRDWMIKRLAAGPGDLRPPDCPATTPGPLVPPGRLVVIGDNPAWSRDSRQVGDIPSERLLGVAVRRIHSEPARYQTQYQPR